jgi:hypothetical protein
MPGFGLPLLHCAAVAPLVTANSSDVALRLFILPIHLRYEAPLKSSMERKESAVLEAYSLFWLTWQIPLSGAYPAVGR